MVNELFILLMSFLIALPISILWVRGIDYMKDNHYDYKGYDLLDEDPKKPIK